MRLVLTLLLLCSTAIGSTLNTDKVDDGVYYITDGVIRGSMIYELQSDEYEIVPRPSGLKSMPVLFGDSIPYRFWVYEALGVVFDPISLDPIQWLEWNPPSITDISGNGNDATLVGSTSVVQTNNIFTNSLFWYDGSFVTNSTTNMYQHLNFMDDVVISGTSVTGISDIITHSNGWGMTSSEYDDYVAWLSDEGSTVTNLVAVTDGGSYREDESGKVYLYKDLDLPLGFWWVPNKVNKIYFVPRETETYIDFSDDLIPSRSDTLYVSGDGDNSDGLTWATAFNEIQTATLNATNDTAIYVTNGVYGSVDVHDNTNRFSFIGCGDSVIISPQVGITDWFDGAGYYSTTISNGTFYNFSDIAFTNAANGYPEQIASVGSGGAVIATEGSYFITGTNLYVHTAGDRTPDGSVFVTSNGSGMLFGPLGGYVTNITTVGGAGGFVSAYIVPSEDTNDFRVSSGPLILDNCRSFQNGDVAYIIRHTSGETYMRNCIGAGGNNDCYNYHSDGTYNYNGVKAIEYRCEAYNFNTAGATQASTGHDEANWVIRAGTSYSSNLNSIVDVNDFKSVNVGLDCGEGGLSSINDTLAWVYGGDFGSDVTGNIVASLTDSSVTSTVSDLSVAYPSSTNFYYWTDTTSTNLTFNGITPTFSSTNWSIDVDGDIPYLRLGSGCTLTIPTDTNYNPIAEFTVVTMFKCKGLPTANFKFSDIGSDNDRILYSGPSGFFSIIHRADDISSGIGRTIDDWQVIVNRSTSTTNELIGTHVDTPINVSCPRSPPSGNSVIGSSSAGADVWIRWGYLPGVALSDDEINGVVSRMIRGDVPYDE